MEALKSKVDSLMGNRIAASTRVAYEAAFRRWEAFAVSHEISALPADPLHIACFLAHLGDSVSYGTAQKITAAINEAHLRKWLPSPTSHPSLQRLMGALKQKAPPAIPAVPMTATILHEAIDYLGRAANITDIRIWRTVWRMVVAFYATLRWSEVSALECGEVTFSDDGGKVILSIRRSKTDQQGRGAFVEMHRQGSGQTLHCPVFLTKQYKRRLGYGERRIGSMQPRIDSAGRARANTRISYDTGSKELKTLLQKLGHGGIRFTEHSGRRGGASAAAAAGVPWLVMKRFWRWESDSAAQRYVSEASLPGSDAAVHLARIGTEARRATATITTAAVTENPDPGVSTVEELGEVMTADKPQAVDDTPSVPAASTSREMMSDYSWRKREEYLAAGLVEDRSLPNIIVFRRSAAE